MVFKVKLIEPQCYEATRPTPRARSADGDPLTANHKLANGGIGPNLARLEDRDQAEQRRADLDLAHQEAVVHGGRGGGYGDNQLFIDVGVDLGGDEDCRSQSAQLVGEGSGE